MTEIERLREALKQAETAMRDVVAGAMRTYKARNGKLVSIQADDGEACDIVHSDLRFQLEAALKTARAALSTPPAAERGEWQGIESAPKDGTTIFGCDAKMAHRGLVHFNERGEWEMVNGLTNWPNGKTFNPTHWHPLHEPPAPPSPRTPEGQ